MSEDKDDLPLTLRAKPVSLDAMSVGELGDYIAELEAEIERVRGEISRKEAQKNAAEAVFRR